MFRPRHRVQRSGSTAADDALLFVPRTVPHALIAGQRYADSSGGHAAPRRRRRGDPGGRWTPSSVRAARGLNAGDHQLVVHGPAYTRDHALSSPPRHRPVVGRDHRKDLTSSSPSSTRRDEGPNDISVRQPPQRLDDARGLSISRKMHGSATRSSFWQAQVAAP